MCNEGSANECYPFVALASNGQGALKLVPSLAAPADTVVPAEGDPLLLLAARGALHADISGLALSVGLNSSLHDAPNATASALAVLRVKNRRFGT